MLGEAARTQKDADIYFERYLAAIDAVGQAAGPFSTMHADALFGRPGFSVKLSALHPRFEPGKEERLAAELAPRMLTLARAARSRGLTLTIDAEEQDRLDLTLEIFAATFTNPALDNWTGLGIAVQAYGKRAIPTLRWLRRLAERSGKRIPVRLVKGAYWDSEIKWAQERALADYPVFTRKLHTDVSYLACVRLLLSDQKAFYSQFATHNAHTIAAAHVAGGPATFEFQRLHGMGEALYDEVVGDKRPDRARAASTRRSAGTRICSPISCAACSRTAPTPPSSTGSPTTRRPSRRSSAIRWRRPSASAAVAPSRNALSRPRDIYLPERARRQRPGADRADGAARAVRRRWAMRSTTSFEAGPIVGGTATTGGDAASLVHLPARPARAHRHGAHHDGRAGRRGDRARGQGRARLGQAGRRQARADPRPPPPTCSSATRRG